ncbi:hypothetical protein HMPREF1985_01846 [Mitsuokella sp. oral taxon 131 str. W9106]|nr:hypothetical protein HMPREF1985_01846 [Mitsuokella sp. oral taxon 131 str. W9106]
MRAACRAFPSLASPEPHGGAHPFVTFGAESAPDQSCLFRSETV